MEKRAHRLLAKAAMIPQFPTNQSQSATEVHNLGLSLIKKILRQWLNNPLTYVLLVWGVLFIGLGLLFLLLP